jgi:hypothetical protein
MVRIENNDFDKVKAAIFLMECVKNLLDLFSNSLGEYDGMDATGNKLHENTTYSVDLSRVCMETIIKDLNRVVHDKATYEKDESN